VKLFSDDRIVPRDDAPDDPPRAVDPVALYLATLTPSSRDTYQHRLRTIARLVGMEPHEVPWAQLRHEHVTAIRSRLMESPLSPATANLTLSALRGVARAAWRLGLMSAEDLARIRDVPRVGGSRLPAGRSATGGELAALLAACGRDPGPLGARDGALLAVLYGGGLRRAEVAALTVDGWDVERRELRVRGKGDKERLVPLPSGAAAALADWLAVRGRVPGALFWRIRKGGHLVARGVTTQAVYDVLVRRAAEASVEDLSPHDLRRTWVGDLLDAGADLATVQQLAGHADVSTTARYDRRGARARRAAADLLHVPHTRRRP